MSPTANADIFSKIFSRHVQRSLGRLEPHQIALGMRKVDALGPGTVVTSGREMLMFSSNNYLGLANDPRVMECASRAVQTWGASTSGSRLLNGTNELHIELEEQLRAFKQIEKVVVFSSGYMANLGVLSALLTEDDVVVIDKLAHASIIDGCKLAGAQVRSFKHQDLESLEMVLLSIEPERSKLVVVDGVYSMDGDFAKLPDIIRIAHRHGARVMVDDAHGTGVAGPNGRGSAEHFGIDEPDIITGTLSKAFGCYGGFVGAKKEIIDFLKLSSRSFIYSTSLCPSATAAVLQALTITREEPERRENLWRCTNYLLRELKSLGFDTGHSETPIIPIILRDHNRMFDLVAALDAESIFVSPVVYPACPKHKPRVRLSLMADHTLADIDHLLDVLDTQGRRLGLLRLN